MYCLVTEAHACEQLAQGGPAEIRTCDLLGRERTLSRYVRHTGHRLRQLYVGNHLLPYNLMSFDVPLFTIATCAVSVQLSETRKRGRACLACSSLGIAVAPPSK